MTFPTVVICALFFWFLCILNLRASAGQLSKPPLDFIHLTHWDTSPKLMGNSEILSCDATGTQPLYYTWIKDDQVLAPYENMTGGALVQLRNLDQHHAGLYQCIASNHHGALRSLPSQLRVAYLENFKDSNPDVKDVHVNLYGYARIALPMIDSVPAPVATWYEGPNRISDSSESYHVYKTLSNDLVILSIPLAHQGRVYQAKVTNHYVFDTERTSRQFRLIVSPVMSKASIEFVLKPQNRTVAQGERHVSFECVGNARNISQLTVTWYRITGSKTELPRQAYFHNRVLKIASPQPAHAGHYECELNYPPRERLVTQFYLSVVVKPSLTSPAQRHHMIDYGEATELSCDYSSDGSATNLTWYQNAFRLPANPRYTVDPSTQYLHISSSMDADSGVYQCFVSNLAGVASSSMWLEVTKYAPVMSAGSNKVWFIAENPAELVCNARGAPKPTFTWYRLQGTTQHKVVSAQRVKVVHNKLLITNGLSEDTGTYICEASNLEGTATRSISLIVATRTRILEPPENIKVIKGTTGTFRCGVKKDINIDVNVTWYRSKDETFDPDRFTMTNDGTLYKLVIQQVRADDIGVYKCVVESVAGNETRAASLKVVELPHRPRIITVQLGADNAKSIEVKWSAPFDGNDVILRYIVQYRRQEPHELDPEGGWQTAADNVPSTGRSFVVPNLLPAQTYQVRVKAANSVGEGPGSLPKHNVTLPQQRPTGAPKGFAGSARSQNSIILQWQLPDKEEWNGPLLGFTVRFRLANYNTPEPSWTMKNISVSDRRYVLKGLITFEEYELNIAAFNIKGTGVYSASRFVRTMEGKPTDYPKKLNVTAVSSTTLKATWNPIDPQRINGINLGYRLEAWTSGNPSKITSKVVDVSPFNGPQEATLESLKKYTNYKVTIQCFTAVGAGPPSPVVEVKTQEDVPGEVVGLTFTDIRDRSMSVSWKPPEKANGIIIGYGVVYNEKGKVLKPTIDLSPSVHNYTITGLKAKTNYTISVFARTSIGVGRSVTTDIRSGEKPELPKPPTLLSLSNWESRSVHVQFRRGYTGKTSISQWIVEGQELQSLASPINPITGWYVITGIHAPDASSLKITNLKPFTTYRLRIVAENVVGQSEPSEPTEAFQTLQDIPSEAPKLTVRVINETTLSIRWMLNDVWNGNPGGFYIWYRAPASETQYRLVVTEPSQSMFTLSELQEWTDYDICMQAYNSVGSGPNSTILHAKTHEGVPGVGPEAVIATVLSSTKIMVSWGRLPLSEQNGKVIGYKIYYNKTSIGLMDPTHRYININNATSRTYTLSGLSKFTQYTIQVLAFTRMGDGRLSMPPALARTMKDRPSPPSHVYFSHVSRNRATVVWQEPVHPNGIINRYHVEYQHHGSSGPIGKSSIIEISADTHEFDAADLMPESTYQFRIAAETDVGRGNEAVVDVYTKENRRVPTAPTQVRVAQSDIRARSVAITWLAQLSMYSPTRNYTVQYQQLSHQWITVEDFTASVLERYTVHSLRPNARYRFRVKANNDVGSSSYSLASDFVQTMQAKPSHPPENVKVVPITTTNVTLYWNTPPADTWNGPLSGYEISYCPLYRLCLTDEHFQSLRVYGLTKLEAKIGSLEADREYEFRVRALNGMGHGPSSRPVVLYVGEAVPRSGVSNVVIQNVSSTSLLVNWSAPDADTTNGQLMGFKIFYWENAELQDAKMPSSRRNQRSIAQPVILRTFIKTVPASRSHAFLRNLSTFANYSVVVGLYNGAGSGPNSSMFSLRTSESIPGPPSELTFYHVLLTSLNISWKEPAQPRGRIIRYQLDYNQADAIGAVSSKAVVYTLKGNQSPYKVTGLIPNALYLFKLSAATSMGYGEPVSSNITIQPQPGSPGPPSDLSYDYSNDDRSAVKVSWRPGTTGSHEITGYIVQVQASSSNRWRTVLPNVSPSQNAKVQVTLTSDNSLSPKVAYTVRVFAVNYVGAGQSSSITKEFLLMARALSKGAFYEQWWFLVIIALCGIIVVIFLVLILCITGWMRRSRLQAKDSHNGTINSIYNDYPSFQSFELHDNDGLSAMHPEPSVQSRQYSQSVGTAASRGSRGSRRRNRYPGPSMSPDERDLAPSLRTGRYSDDETITKRGRRASDSSSLTEKPSLDSGTDSRQSDSDVDSLPPPPPHAVPSVHTHSVVSGGSGATHSTSRSGRELTAPSHSSTPPRPTHSTFTGGRSAVSHYQNTGILQGRPQNVASSPSTVTTSGTAGGLPGYDTAVRAQRSRQKPQNAYSYTDSEGESGYAVSLTGRHAVSSNTDGSRNAFPGFSSFV